jgi:hypothetical protein
MTTETSSIDSFGPLSGACSARGARHPRKSRIQMAFDLLSGFQSFDSLPLVDSMHWRADSAAFWSCTYSAVMWPLLLKLHTGVTTALYYPRLFWLCIIPGMDVFTPFRQTHASLLRAHVIPSAYCTAGMTGENPEWGSTF